MLEDLKKEVFEANIELVEHGLVIYTWGNASGIDRETGLVVIKPSGIGYDVMTPEDMVVVDLASGKRVEGKWKPSSDTETHLEIYRHFKDVKGIAHTHSINATSFAQAGKPIRALGTTHADYFYGDVPCTRELSQEEVELGYEHYTGRVIVETIDDLGYNPMDIPGILVKNHGPFSWGDSPAKAVYHSVVMETVSEMNIKTMFINPDSSMAQYVLDKHYNRKHGKAAYYGQK